MSSPATFSASLECEFVGFDQYFISLERFENEQIYMQNANAMQNMQNEWHAASRHRLQRAQRTPTIVGQAANEKPGHFYWMLGSY